MAHAHVEDKRNSPFNSFLIDDPTPTDNNRITITNEESTIICTSCQQDLRVCSSKILACLHAVCSQCLDKIKDSSGKNFDYHYFFIDNDSVLFLNRNYLFMYNLWS